MMRDHTWSPMGTTPEEAEHWRQRLSPHLKPGRTFTEVTEREGQWGFGVVLTDQEDHA